MILVVAQTGIGGSLPGRADMNQSTQRAEGEVTSLVNRLKPNGERGRVAQYLPCNSH